MGGSSYYHIMKGQLAWKDVLPSKKLKKGKRCHGAPPLVPHRAIDEDKVKQAIIRHLTNNGPMLFRHLFDAIRVFHSALEKEIKSSDFKITNIDGCKSPLVCLSTHTQQEIDEYIRRHDMGKGLVHRNKRQRTCDLIIEMLHERPRSGQEISLSLHINYLKLYPFLIEVGAVDKNGIAVRVLLEMDHERLGYTDHTNLAHWTFYLPAES